MVTTIVIGLIYVTTIILNFIKRGEYDQAKKCLRFHMEKTWEQMKESFLRNEVAINHMERRSKLWEEVGRDV